MFWAVVLEGIATATAEYLRSKYPCDCQDEFDKFVRAARKKQGIEDPPFVCEVDHSRGRELVDNLFIQSPIIQYIKSLDVDEKS